MRFRRAAATPGFVFKSGLVEISSDHAFAMIVGNRPVMLGSVSKNVFENALLRFRIFHKNVIENEKNV